MPKKIPLLMCVACRGMFEKKELLRVVRNADGFSIDATGKKSGRGAYVCKKPECFEKCLKKRLLDKAFDEKLPDEAYKSLGEEYAKYRENN